MKTSVVQEESALKVKSTSMFFPEGIIGFSEHKEFEIIHDRSKEPFVWLESVQDNNLAFIIIDPNEFQKEYNPVLSAADKMALQITDLSECSIYALVCVPKDSDEISANLLAPIILNKNNKIGRQVILHEQDYSVQHLILEDMLRKIEDTDVSSFAQTK
ncbi:MAG: flagellar assembly protein FliW [Candidatus Omnitrophica bacterium]|nr:flagellar assembly protein FliW [Candidatus Omnitrophota bacterium]